MICFTKVKLPYGWLGNMSPYPIVYADLRWPTTEHLFQALRFPPDSKIREEIRTSKSPMGAKMAAKKHASEMVVTPRSPEDLDLMRLCLRLKVDQHPDIRRFLLATKDEQIVEDASNRPNVSGLFWGLCKQADDSWKGENSLGVLWMELRSTLRSTS